jgi:hypothetical protein
VRSQSSDCEAPRSVLLHEGTELPQKSWPIRQLKATRPMRDSVLRGFIDRKSIDVTQKCEAKNFVSPVTSHVICRSGESQVRGQLAAPQAALLTPRENI